MHIVRYLLWIAFVLGITFSCVRKEKTRHKVDFSSIKRIDVPDNVTIDEIQDIIELDSYIPLSNEVLVGRVERIIIHDDRVYILDNEPKIICFNMKGKVVFKIDNRGAGPTEYQNLRDFAIDGNSKRIIAFDNEKRKLSFYDLKTGKYLSSIPTLYMAPTEMGFIDGEFFFKNIDIRFDVQKEHQFYLLHSESGKQIDTMYLPHDAVADFNFDMKSFFYNEGNLLFVRPFDNIVYALQKAEITPVYEINLPNSLPMKLIEAKMRHIEIPNSGYAYGIDDVHVVGKILHFTYSKDGFIVSTFFDLSTNTFLYNGIRVLANARKNLPIYSLINGVYDGKFFALVSAPSIVEKRTSHPEFFSGELSKITEEDNDVLAFFTIKDSE
ncbi:MAG: hypothetical protein BWZ00_01670 [Bacteroidetes bacterium ADurb.BinA174]|nr:MAG: hypothetical protein BWZ00_01670 [Bacteroidetes bacterium ADurb.BinA174]